MSAFPAVNTEDGFLTRREQIGGKKRKKEKKQAGNCEDDEQDDDGEDERPKKKAKAGQKKGSGTGRGRGNGRGRGRGRGVMKKPASKKAASKLPPPPEDAEGEEEEEKEEDADVEEGAGSAGSAGPAERQQLRRARHFSAEPSSTADLPAEPSTTTADLPAEPSQPNHAPKAKAKGKAKSKPTPEPREQFAWEPELVAEILACLKECKDAGEYGSTAKHTHRECSPLDDYVQFSVYWSRKAVGVKIRRKLSEKWVQVAYFARDTPCVFTNVILATAWAT